MRTRYHTYSPDEWQQIMMHYASSGLSQKAFCQQEGLAMSTFSKWRKQLGLGLAPTRSVKDPLPPADFKPLITMPCLRFLYNAV